MSLQEPSKETTSIRPNKEQFVELASSPDEGPVVMLNLLKFKARAEGEDGSGADAYKRYGEAAVKMVEEQGGRVLWQGRADQILIGDPEQDWDSVVLVEYPSRKAFIEMVTTRSTRPRTSTARRVSSARFSSR